MGCVVVSFLFYCTARLVAADFEGSVDFVSPSFGQVFPTSATIPFALHVACPSHVVCFEIICLTIDRKWHASRDLADIDCLPKQQTSFELSGFAPGTHTVHVTPITATMLEAGVDAATAFLPLATIVFETLPDMAVLDVSKLHMQRHLHQIVQSNVKNKVAQQSSSSFQLSSNTVRVALLSPVSSGNNSVSLKKLQCSSFIF